MRRLKLLICLILLVAVFPHIDVKAGSNVVTYELDNDEANNPNGTNAYSGTWDYLTGTRHFRGDARISKSRKTTQADATLYIWGYKGTTGPLLTNPSIYVYLNDAKFTSSKANYQCHIYPGSGKPVPCLNKIVNQNVAPTGWGYIGTAMTYSKKRVSHVSVVSTIEENGYIGADGIRLVQPIE